MNGNPQVKPSAWFYLLGALAILAGISVFVYTLLHGIFHITDNLTQIVVPGEKDLSLLPNLTYTVFLEEQSVVDGRIYSTKEGLGDLTCKLASLSSGKNINLRRARRSTTYNVGQRSGHSVLEFVTQEAGVYHFACDYEEGKQGPQVVLAVGAGVAEGIFATIGRSFAAIFGGGILGAAILVTVFILREHAKRKLNQYGQFPIA